MLKTTWTTLISKITENLEAVTEIKKVHAHPVSKIDKYPAAIFYPDSFENSFDSNQDNFKIYKFKLFIVIGAAQTNFKEIFEKVLPKTVDAVLAKFDSEWDGGTLEGHRISYLLDSGTWGASEENNGLEAYAELNLTIKLLTSN